LRTFEIFDAQHQNLGRLSVAVEKGAILAGRKGPAVWLRDGQMQTHQCEDTAGEFFLAAVMFRSFRLLGAVGFAFDFQDDRSLDKTVEECHRQRTVNEIFTPLIKVHVGNHGGGAFLIARSDDLVEQVGRLRTFDALDFVESEFIDDQKVWFRVAAQPQGKGFIGERSGEVGE